jgi:hypothetical protein
MLRCEACGASLARRPAGERQPTKCAQCRGQPQVRPKLPPKQQGEQSTRSQSYDAEWLKLPRMPWDT